MRAFIIGIVTTILVSGCGKGFQAVTLNSSSDSVTQANTKLCTPDAQQSCQSGNGIGSQTCDSSGSSWSACGNFTSCNSGFNVQNGACISNVCTPNVQQSCQAGNGTGSQTCDSFGSSWSACGNFTSCNSGFNMQNGTCVSNVCTLNAQQSCQAGNGTGSQNCNSQGSTWSACGNLTTCNSGYDLQNGTCVASVWRSPSKLKGAFFNFKALNSENNDIGEAWQTWLSRDAAISVSAARELDLLKSKAPLNFVYIMVSSGQIGWPASAINSSAYSSLATFINLARSRGISVGVSLNTHCVVNNGYAYTIGRQSEFMGTKPGGWMGCSDSNIQDSKDWYSAVIRGVENLLGSNKEAIAFWEMSGNPEFGASEIPMWTGSVWTKDVTNAGNGKTYLGIETFIKNVWPVFKTISTRPTAVTFLPLKTGGSTPDNISTLTNFQSWIPWWNSGSQPDYFIFTSSPTIPIDKILNLRSNRAGDVPAEKVILGDFKWQQNPIELIYNPRGLSAADVARGQFSLVRNYNLAGWWAWAFRDKNPGPTDPAWARTEGFVGFDSQWKTDLANEVIIDLNQ